MVHYRCLKIVKKRLNENKFLNILLKYFCIKKKFNMITYTHTRDIANIQNLMRHPIYYLLSYRNNHLRCLELTQFTGSYIQCIQCTCFMTRLYHKKRGRGKRLLRDKFFCKQTDFFFDFIKKKKNKDRRLYVLRSAHHRITDFCIRCGVNIIFCDGK